MLLLEPNIQRYACMDDSSAKHSILKFCPGCGTQIEWNRDVRFCMHCGMYIIPFIPQDQIQEWLGESLTPEEIHELYSQREQKTVPPPATPPSYYLYRTRKPWKIGAALGVPLLAVIAKFIASFIILFVYILITVEDFATIDIESFLNENLLPITIIELLTQLLFLLISYLFTSIFFPYKAPAKERWESIGIPFGLKGSQWLKEIGIGIAFSLIMTGLVYGVQWISAYLTQFLFGISAQDLLTSDTDSITSPFPNTIPFLIVYSLLMIFSVAPSEEVLFRGFCQKGIQDTFRNQKTGKVMGLIITAVYFSLFHIYTLVVYPPILFFAFFPYFSLSLVLGFLYMWRKNLLSAITAHALYNIIQFLIVILIIP